jgi:hypothetical protein
VTEITDPHPTNQISACLHAGGRQFDGGNVYFISIHVEHAVDGQRIQSMGS